MAFTNVQKVDIRFYLGWPQTYLQTYSALEYAMQAIEHDSDMVAKVVALLTALIAIDVSIVDAYRRIKADEIDSIKLGRMTEINILRSEGRRLVGRLSSTLNTGKRSDVFSNGGTPQSNALTII